MKITVLGWGSLICDPRNLSIHGKWNEDGPELPVEFARISNDKRLTLVILPDANPLPVLWALMNTQDLNQAIIDLKEREVTSLENIGFINLVSDTQRSNIISTAGIKKWAREKKIDVVIWTDLPSNFTSIIKMPLNDNNVVLYLTNLKNIEKQMAEQYVRKTPNQIKTKFRICIEEELGWTAERGLRN